MKNFILVIISFLFASTGFSQSGCNFRINESDEVTHISKRMLEFAPWFSSRDEELKSNAEGDNVICDISMGDLSGSKILNIKIVVMSTKAQKYFGEIGVKAPLRMIMDDGEMIELNAQSPDRGTVDGKSNSTTYETKYAVSDQVFEKYKSKQIKKVRIFWSETRFSDHDVNFPKALMEQAKCF